ncbi:MAG TPA: hypothetical protein VHP63_06730 [candidate division Zixibacteria bacterium]|nr:hypothetical protein [candidate division Zixibacteria bacterium]
MRKYLVAALTIFALALAIGMITAEQPQAAGPSPNCWWTCDCAGNPIYCCRSGNTTTCYIGKNAPIACTQGYNC